MIKGMMDSGNGMWAPPGENRCLVGAGGGGTPHHFLSGGNCFCYGSLNVY